MESTDTDSISPFTVESDGVEYILVPVNMLTESGMLKAPIKLPAPRKKRVTQKETEGTCSGSSRNPPVFESEQNPESVKDSRGAKAGAEDTGGKKRANNKGNTKGLIKERGTNGSGPSVPNPSSVPLPNSNSTEGRESPGSEGGANNFPPTTSRRIFTPAFKQAVLNAFATDPDCIGNQRATARKFAVHRRQVQKWLLQNSGSGSTPSSGGTDRGSSSDEHNNLIIDENPTISSNRKTSPNPSDLSVQREETPPETAEAQPKASPTSSTDSSSASNSQIDLCKMTSSAMALSLNLTMNNHLGGLKSHSMPSTSIPLPSPTSFLQKFYGLAFHPNNIGASPNYPSPTNIPVPSPNYQKYEGLNLNPPPPPPKPAPVSTNSFNSKARHNGGTQNHQPHTPPHIQLVDEIAAVYPNDDFDLLRHALMRNEVTFSKLTGRVPKSNFFPPNRIGRDSHNGNGKNGPCRTRSPSVSPEANEQAAAFSAHQTLELLRQQSEYVKYIQQAGLNGINFPSLSPDPAYAAAAESIRNKSKHPWLHPLAQAAAAASMGYQGSNGHRKSQPQSDQHTFASPKLPANSKPKTVAAALAASRLSPNSLLSNIFEPLLPPPPSKRKLAVPAQRKRKSKQNNKPNCTITRPPTQDEDYLDPTSILEVTTSSGSEGTNSTNIVDLPRAENYPYLNGHHTSPNEDLVNGESPTSKLKKYLENFTNSSPSPPEESSPNMNAEADPEMTKNMALEAFTYDPEVAGDARAVARKYGLSARVVMKWVKESSPKSFPMNNSFVQSNGPLKTNGTTSILNGIMMNYMNSLEPNNLTVPNTIPTSKTNGDSYHRNSNFETDYVPEQKMNGGNGILKKGYTTTSSNKRKTSKPNQICDFQQEDDDFMYGNEPVDMMVPIKKRRLSAHE